MIISGFSLRPDLLSLAAERELLSTITSLSFAPLPFHGQRSRRGVAFFGYDYIASGRRVVPSTPLPAWLLEVRSLVAGAFGVAPDAFEQVIVSRYPPGAGIGRHTDAPVFGPTVLGLSLGSSCRFVFRHPDGRRVPLALPARSAYALTGEARTTWTHEIPPVRTLRYSLTFRSVSE